MKKKGVFIACVLVMLLFLAQTIVLAQETNAVDNVSSQTGQAPIGQAYESFSSDSVISLQQPSDTFSFIKNSFIYVILLLVVSGLLVGGYYGYNKIIQGHYAEVPEQVNFNSQVYNYIKNCTAKGFSKKAIYTKLKGLGFKEEELEYHFNMAGGNVVDRKVPKAK